MIKITLDQLEGLKEAMEQPSDHWASHIKGPETFDVNTRRELVEKLKALR